MYLNAVVSGLLLGGFYAIVALGLSIVFGVLRLINVAHGELVVAGAYLAFLANQLLGVSSFVALPFVVAIVVCLGYVLQRYLLTGLLLRGSEGALVATFGISLFAQGILTQGFGSNPRSLDSSLSTGGVAVFGVDTRTVYVLAFGVAGVVCVAAHLVLTNTRAGAWVRAAAADPTTAGLMGIDVRRVYALTFAVGAGIAAIGGVVMGVTFSFTPSSGIQYLLVGIAVVVLGGVGNILGTFLGALSLGVVQSLAAAQFGGGYRDLAVYVLFFIVLAVRPEGLFARRAAT